MLQRLVKAPERGTIKRVIREICENFGFPQDGSPISGVFNGAWCGSGPVIESIDPSTRTLIARIKTASESDFASSLPEIRQAQLQWRMVSLFHTQKRAFAFTFQDSRSETW
jgi:hypothetical protein